MTDKEIVERAKEAEKGTGFGELVHSPISKGVNSAFGIGFIEGMVEYRNSLQEESVNNGLDLGCGVIWKDEEPVSEDLEIELEKYIKGHFTIDTEQLDRFGIEEKDYMYSMDKSDMLALVEHFTNWQKTKEEPVSEGLEEAADNALSDVLNTHEIVNVRSCLEMFRFGANWKEQQFEKERLKHCDELTDEQAQIESDFVTQHLKENNRTPTFIDAIEYGKKMQKEQMMAKAIDGEVGYWNLRGLSVNVKLPRSVGEGDKVKVLVVKDE